MTSSPTINSLLPRSLISPLKKLGQTDWFTFTTGTERNLLRIDNNVSETLVDEPEFLLALRNIGPGNGNLLLQFFAFSKLLADGPKIVQPTYEHCEALAHVDLNLKFRDYQQPFPIFLVEIPESFRQHLSEQYSIPCPRFVMPFHHVESEHLTVFCFHDGMADDQGVFTVFSRNMLDDTMEASLGHFNGNDGQDYHQSMVLHRIALNLALLLTGYGFRDEGPLDPKTYEKQTRLSRSKSKRKAAKAQQRLDASLTRISFDQDLLFSRRAGSVASRSATIGSRKSPHWRRGHFRTLKRSGKLVFVRPCFINADHFAGDRSETEYRIRTDGADLSKCSV